jgi:hypothetical protein
MPEMAALLVDAVLTAGILPVCLTFNVPRAGVESGVRFDFERGDARGVGAVLVFPARGEFVFLRAEMAVVALARLSLPVTWDFGLKPTWCWLRVEAGTMGLLKVPRAHIGTLLEIEELVGEALGGRDDILLRD